jgi:transcriptional regulator with XRE-family HTH domain
MNSKLRDIRLGQRMRVLSKRSKQQAVAVAMHISPDKLRKFERGERLPSLDELDRFCDAGKATDEERRELFGLLRIAAATEQQWQSSPDRLLLEPLSLGSRETDFVIIDGTGRVDIPPSNVRVRSDQDVPGVECPSHLREQFDAFRAQFEQEISRRQRERTLDKPPSNGDIKSVCRISTTRDASTDIPKWEITTRPYKYFPYMSLRTHLDTEFLHEGEKTTLRELYLLTANFNPFQPPPFLNFLGSSLIVYLPGENCLVITKRGATAIYPYTFGASVGEMAHSEKDKDGDASHTASRGVEEELDIALPPPTYLSLGYTRRDCQYELLGYITADDDLSFEKVKRSIPMAPDGKFEVADVYPIPATPIEDAFRALCERTIQENMIWPPTPMATLLLTLRRLHEDKKK